MLFWLLPLWLFPLVCALSLLAVVQGLPLLLFLLLLLRLRALCSTRSTQAWLGHTEGKTNTGKLTRQANWNITQHNTTKHNTYTPDFPFLCIFLTSGNQLPVWGYNSCRTIPWHLHLLLSPRIPIVIAILLPLLTPIHDAIFPVDTRVANAAVSINSQRGTANTSANASTILIAIAIAITITIKGTVVVGFGMCSVVECSNLSSHQDQVTCQGE